MVGQNWSFATPNGKGAIPEQFEKEQKLYHGSRPNRSKSLVEVVFPKTILCLHHPKLTQLFSFHTSSTFTTAFINTKTGIESQV